MKLLRFGPKSQEKPAILDADGYARDLSQYVSDISGSVLTPESLKKIAHIDTGTLPLVNAETRIGPCVGHVGKIVCVGLNYADHAAETNLRIPREPVIFMKATTAINGPHDPIILPPKSTTTDWEVELGVVIGSTAKYVSENAALDHVAGYCIVNDVSERTNQTERSGQWVKGKSADTFAPIGPWLVTKDDIEDVQNLSLYTEINGHRYQDGSTQTMVAGVARLVSYISEFMRLEPGDIIATGTPAGVGMGQTPPTYLKAGDQIEMGIAGLGVQKCVVQSEAV